MKTIIKVWFDRGEELASRFDLIEYSGTWAQFRTAVLDDDMIDATRLFTRKITLGSYEIADRTPTMFRGSAVGKCEENVAVIEEEAV